MKNISRRSCKFDYVILKIISQSLNNYRMQKLLLDEIL